MSLMRATVAGAGFLPWASHKSSRASRVAGHLLATEPRGKSYSPTDLPFVSGFRAEDKGVYARTLPGSAQK